MFTVALTGGIGSGKSTVANLFAHLGATVIDMDVLARELTAPDSHLLEVIASHFGSSIKQVDGSLNRAALRDIIFSDSDARLWLEQLLHPAIRTAMHKAIAECLTPYCIAVIPLLAETERDATIQRVLVVDTTPELQKARTITRDHLNAEQMTAMLRAQSSREARLKLANDVIMNVGDKEALVEQVKKLHETYLKLAKGGAK